MISESEIFYECSILLLTDENEIGKHFQEEIEKIKKTEKNKVKIRLYANLFIYLCSLN